MRGRAGDTIMSHEALLLIAILAPILGSVLLVPAGMLSLRLRNVLSLVFVGTALAASAALVPAAFGGQAVRVFHALPLGLNFSFTADALAVFMAIVSSLISLIIVLYSTDYIKPYPNANEYYFLVTLFLGSMMGLVYASNLILLYGFWEVTAITSWRLIGFFREEHQVRRANKAFLVTMFGAVAMLLGFIVLGSEMHSFDLDVIKSRMGTTPVSSLATGLILMGMLSKSATLPFQSWLPDAGVAPSPVTSLLHAAVLVKIGVYVYARLFVATMVLDPQWQTFVMVLAAASALVSACGALVETDLKRIIAYSTVSQLAFIFLGLASGTRIGIAGGLLYILMHGFAKGGLFLCAGIVEQKTHSKDINKLGGLIKTMPLTAVAFLLCAFSVMGLPPFGGFFSKYMVISGSVQHGVEAGGGIWLPVTFLAGAVLTILYLIRVFNRVFMGQAHGEGHEVREGSRLMVGCVLALAILGLAGGIFIRPPAQMAQTAMEQMIGGGK